jgi:hypothetical protein
VGFLHGQLDLAYANKRIKKSEAIEKELQLERTLTLPVKPPIETPVLPELAWLKETQTAADKLRVGGFDDLISQPPEKIPIALQILWDFYLIGGKDALRQAYREDNANFEMLEGNTNALFKRKTSFDSLMKIESSEKALKYLNERMEKAVANGEIEQEQMNQIDLEDLKYTLKYSKSLEE